MKDSLSKSFLTPYLKKRPLFYSFTRPFEAALYQKYLPTKKPVLDYGCGDGFFAGIAFRSQKQIEVGFDVDRRIKNEAFNSKMYKRVVISRKRKMPFPDNYFSSILSNCVFEHINELDFYLSELYRITKKRGRIYTTVATDVWEKNLLGAVFFGSLYKKWFRRKQKHYNLFSKNKWINCFRKAGFTVVEATPYLSLQGQRWCELFHYLSFPCLVYKKIFNRWTILDNWPLRGSVSFLLKKNDHKDNFSCCFFVLEKEKKSPVLLKRE